MIGVKSLWALLKETVSQWSDDFAPSMGAALAYYAVFSIAPLIVIAIAVAGFFLGNDAAQGHVFTQIRGVLGDQGATAVEAAVRSASQNGKGLYAGIAGIVALLLGATSVFGELQSDLDRIWDVPKPEHPGIRGMIAGRVHAFAMVLCIGLLLLVSLALATAVSALGHFSSALLPGWEWIAQAINFIVSFAVIMLLFALTYKVLPRCDIGWGDVWTGAAVTSLLFAIGKLLIGLYLGKSSVASSYGAAGALVILLLWVYYSAQIFLFGAEFTYLYSYRHGTRSGHARPARKASSPGRKSVDDGKPSQPDEAERGDRALHPTGAQSAAPAFHRPAAAVAKLQIAAGIAATLGLIAGEVLNELRRDRRVTRASRR